MAKKITKKHVLFNLELFGNGYIIPADITDVRVWEKALMPSEQVYVGVIDSDKVKNHKSIIKTITKKAFKEHFDTIKSERLKEFKAKMYKKYCDPMFMEALRKKELGNDTKWNEMNHRALMIKSLTEIPEKLDMEI